MLLVNTLATCIACALVLAGAIQSVALGCDPGNASQALGFIVYEQRLPWPAPNHAVIKRAFVQTHPERLAATSGEVLFQSDNDEGIAEFRIAPTQDCLLSAINTSVPWNTSTNDLWLISLGKGSNKKITADNAGYRNLEWSSDGSLISYISNEGASQGSGDTSGQVPANLYAYDAETGKQKRLLQQTVSSRWLPGNRLLAATSHGKQGLFLLDPDSGKQITILQNAKGGYLAVSPDGRLLAWVYDNHLAIIASPMKAAQLRIPTSWKSVQSVNPSYVPEQFSFSPDGTLLALTLPVFGANIRLPRQLTILRTMDGKVGLLGTVLGVPRHLRWSLDGQSVVFVRGTYGPEFVLHLSSVALGEPQYRSSTAVDWTNHDQARVSELVQFPPGSEYIDWVESE